MKQKRIIVRGVGVYHVFNRTAYSRYTLDESEREMFVTIMRKQAAFSGVEVLSYCVMSNHYHMLVRVPTHRQAIDDAELIRRYRCLYRDDPAPRTALRPSDLEAVLRENGAAAAAARKQLYQRMHCLSVFMKELQQRFGIWYNMTHGNKGTLWSERFRSVLVEHNPSIMRLVAAYIELNPVRAGMVNRPELYAWCSLSAALAGNAIAQAGIRAITGYSNDYARALAIYARHIYGVIDRPREISASINDAAEPTSDPNDADKSPKALLRKKVAAFTRGTILGTENFIRDFRSKYLSKFGFSARKNLNDQPVLHESVTDIWALRNPKV